MLSLVRLAGHESLRRPQRGANTEPDNFGGPTQMLFYQFCRSELSGTHLFGTRSFGTQRFSIRVRSS
ncbi:hypothetical protein ACSMXN_04740 [Jatrophihabitans sp. DSM 45814]